MHNSLRLAMALACLVAIGQPSAQAAPLAGESMHECVVRETTLRPAAQRSAFMACGCESREHATICGKAAEEGRRAHDRKRAAGASGTAPSRASPVRPESPEQTHSASSQLATYECFVSTKDAGTAKLQVQAASEDAAKAASERTLGNRAFQHTASCRRIRSVEPQQGGQEQAARQQAPTEAAKRLLGDVFKIK